MDIWSSLTEQKHPRWEQLKRERRAKEREIAMQRARERAREFNAAG